MLQKGHGSGGLPNLVGVHHAYSSVRSIAIVTFGFSSLVIRVE